MSHRPSVQYHRGDTHRRIDALGSAPLFPRLIAGARRRDPMRTPSPTTCATSTFPKAWPTMGCRSQVPRPRHSGEKGSARAALDGDGEAFLRDTWPSHPFPLHAASRVMAPRSRSGSDAPVRGHARGFRSTEGSRQDRSASSSPFAPCVYPAKPSSMDFHHRGRDRPSLRYGARHCIGADRLPLVRSRFGILSWRIIQFIQ